jgi:hypothetical protein
MQHSGEKPTNADWRSLPRVDPAEKLTEFFGVKLSAHDIEQLHSIASMEGTNASVMVRKMIKRLIQRYKPV